MSERKFRRKYYKAVFEVTVVANEPIHVDNLSEIDTHLINGDWQGMTEMLFSKEAEPEDVAEIAFDPEALGLEWDGGELVEIEDL